MLAPFLTAILALSTTSLAADGETAKETEKLKGAWLVTGGEHNGRPVPEEEVKKKTIFRFTTDKVSATEEGKAVESEQSYKLDPTQNPKVIDITPETPSRGLVRGIYQLKGDVLTICVGEPGKPRPVKFETKPGSGHFLAKLKRVKP